MNNNNTNYSQKENKRKILIAVLVAVFVFLLLAAVAAAYYSSYVRQNGDFSASRLEISGSYTVKLNDSEVQLVDIKTLDPGDVITVSGTISNIGNQSAWIREKISFTVSDDAILSYIKVYNIALTQAELLSATDYSANLLTLTEGSFATGSRVINGSGDNAQIESGGSFTYIGASQYSFEITIYFEHDAPNSTQGITVATAITTQALQFANNNTEVPNESKWLAVA